MAEDPSKSSCPDKEKTLGYPDKGQGAEGKKEKISKEECDHPETHRVNGANQYGKRQRCLKCQSKISYTPHEKRQVKKEKGATVIYVKEEKNEELEVAKKNRSKEKGSGAASSSEVRAMQETLVESNQQLLTGMTSLLGQAMGPIVQGQQALMEMSQQAMMGQGAMLQAMQNGQTELTQAVLRLAQSKEDQEWGRVEEESPDPHGR